MAILNEEVDDFSLVVAKRSRQKVGTITSLGQHAERLLLVFLASRAKPFHASRGHTSKEIVSLVLVFRSQATVEVIQQ